MPGPMTPDLIYQLTSVSDPALSPDGRRLAYVRSRVDSATMASDSRVLVMDLPDGEPSVFSDGARDSLPRFSPDGASIAFLRFDGKERRQIRLVPARGGRARQLTHLPGGVIELVWAPNSQALVLVSDVDPDRVPDDQDSKAGPRVRVVRRIQYRADTIGWRGDAHRHLFTVGVDGGEPRQLTDGDWDDGAPVWSPDGSRVAFISARREDRDLVSFNEVYVVAAGGGEPELWSAGLSSVAAVAWSPDSSSLVVVGSDDDDVGAGWQGRLFVLKPGEAPVRLTDDSIKPVASFTPVFLSPELRWTGDGRIVFLGDARGESYLAEVPAAGGPLRPVAGGGAAYTSVATDARAEVAVVLGGGPSSSGDLHLIELDSGSIRRLTEYNGEYFRDHPAASLEKFSLSRNGAEIESRLWLPPDFDPAKNYPLLVDIHGGPNGAFYDSFNPLQQVLATSGYLVLCVNPRGSSTYGVDFMKAVLRDWGGEDYLDIMAAVEEVCARPYVDSSRLGLHGYSYGGYMTSWIIGHDTRFEAAVIGAPCMDLPSIYGTSDIGVSFGEVQWGGMPMDDWEKMRQRSPLAYASKVETPALLLHGEADHRCPIEQSEQYFVALKRLGKEVEFVRFPGCSHLFNRTGHPRMREEYLKRTLAWFDTHLGSHG